MRHVVQHFECGAAPLDRYLHRHALQSQLSGGAVTYLAVTADNEVVGYYTLAVGEVAFDVAAERLRKGLARHPVPIMLIARLAVAKTMQRQGLGEGLLKDAILRTIAAADIAGIRALVVHAKDSAAKAFYEKYDFSPSPSDPLHLHVLVKDLRRIVARVYSSTDVQKR